MEVSSKLKIRVQFSAFNPETCYGNSVKVLHYLKKKKKKQTTLKIEILLWLGE